MTTFAATKTDYEAVIGLETHCQLSTKSKIFCKCSTRFSSPPNTNICPICLGYPGVLPVLNQEVLESAIKLGLALDAKITRYTKFDRKQYFYPDLPKNYQISQYDLPIVQNGHLNIELFDKKTGHVAFKRIGITRLHMEEDAGKLVHAGSDRLSGSTHSLVDYNRAGVPLLEIVSEPDIRSGLEAAEYVQEIRRLVRFLGIGDGNMQEGSLRCDVNISVRPTGNSEFGTKVEIKNMNSFSAIQKAIEYEIERQIETIENGGRIVQETRLWEESSQKTISMRTKEGASDYRYFPEPDLPPFKISNEYLQDCLNTLPELPAQKRQRYQNEFGLSAYDARVLADEKNIAEYFEATLNEGANPKLVANWISQDIAAFLNTNKISISDISLKPDNLAQLVNLIENKTISNKIGKDILPELLIKGGSVKEIIEKKGLVQISDLAEIEKIVMQVIAEHPAEVEKYQAGKASLQGFFVGQVMKKSGGKADPKLTNELIVRKLQSQT